MDELNNFKQAWRTISEAESEKEYSADDLKRIVKKRSNNELTKIRRKLIFEWSLAVFISMLLVIVIYIINPADTIYALLFIGLILGISFIPYFKVLRLRFSQYNDLKNHLTGFLDSFESLVSQYIKMSTILLPVAGLGGFLLGFHSTAGTDAFMALFTIKNILILLFSVAVISFIGHWLQRRYFNWIYGKNLERLRKCLHDLEEVQDTE